MARARKNKQASPDVGRLKAEVNRLQVELRESLVQRIIDLEVAAGTAVEKERSKRVQELMDPSKFPSFALDEIHKTILGMLAMRNPAHKEATDQTHLTREYIQ